ncbi:MAG: hypothetical protein ACI9XO_002897 [Paraglaciecola sp.]|jgi:hypothetical protein
MKIYHIILVLYLFAFFSCETKVPPLITDEKLIKILADVHLSEAAATSLLMKQKDTTLAKYYGQIMEMHEVLRADFDSTMVILKQNPEKMVKIYEKVLEQIDTEKANLNR